VKRTIRFLLALVAGLVASAACAQITYPNPIKHVILIDQENRTVDNLLGSNSPSNQYYLPGLVVSTTGQAYTITAGKKTVFTVNAVSVPMASTLGSTGSVNADDYDPSHSHTSWGKACDAPVIADPSSSCALDGFNYVTVTCAKGATGCPGPKYPTYAYVEYSQVAPYFQMASQYGYANYMFQTNQGPSFPAHQFIFGGTSQPGNGVEPSWFVAENEPTKYTVNGCAAIAGTIVALVNPATQDEKTSMFPCFNHATMADVFAAASPQITWTYYNPGNTSLLTAPNSMQSICTVKGGKCSGPYWTKAPRTDSSTSNPPMF
jgi:phospholipase C